MRKITYKNKTKQTKTKTKTKQLIQTNKTIHSLLLKYNK